MTLCRSFLLEGVFSKLPGEPRSFFDLVDPSSRSERDIREMLGVLARFRECWQVTLGLKQNEANLVSRLSGGSTTAATEPEAALKQCQELRNALKVDMVVVHSIRYAVPSSADERSPRAGGHTARIQRNLRERVTGSTPSMLWAACLG